MVLSERDGYEKRATASECAIHAHGATMQSSEFMHQSQADPCALVSSAAGVGNAVKAIEQARYFLGRNSNPGVADPQLRRVSNLIQTDFNFSIKCELESVGDQIEDDLLPHVPVDIGDFPGRLAIHDKAQASALRGGTENTCQFSRERREVRCLID